jgi:hypothetical protein
MQKRAVGDWIIKRQHLFQMRSGWPELAAIHQVSTGGAVTQNKAGGIIALTAQTQQFFVQAQRKFASVIGGHSAAGDRPAMFDAVNLMR